MGFCAFLLNWMEEFLTVVQQPKMNGNSQMYSLVSVMYMGFSLFAVCVCVLCVFVSVSLASDHW